MLQKYTRADEIKIKELNQLSEHLNKDLNIKREMLENEVRITAVRDEDDDAL